MLEKYRVNEVAKDLGTSHKEILELLARFFEEPKKMQSALQEAELNVVFEIFTRERAVENFDAYFALGNPAAAAEPASPAPSPPPAQATVPTEPVLPAEPVSPSEPAPLVKPAPSPAPPKSAPPEKTEPEQIPVPEKSAKPETARPETGGKQPAAGERKPEAGKVGQPGQPAGQKGKPGQPSAGTNRPGGNGNKGERPPADRPTGDRQGANRPRGERHAGDRQATQAALAATQAKRQQGQQNQPVQGQPQSAQQPPKKKIKEGAPQARTKGEARTVDTRSGNVDLDKYNERYEQIAPANQQGPRGDHQVNKQKLKQKSQQYRRGGGMRSARRETESERLKRIAAERARKPQLVIKVPEEIVVSELAAMLKRTAAEVVQKLFVSLAMKITANEVIDYDTAELVATELGARVEREVVVTIEDRIIDDSIDKAEDLQPRDPVVVVMGHVDHGKTSLLDAIRNTAVTETEAGGITQHIGASQVECNGKQITFLDTPGHAAFTSMRARGAQATDIAILVVAADDGIMPQTVEAINHAKAAEVTIIVAINKMDKPAANPDRVLQQLTEYELLPEAWGGDTICVPVSAVTRQGIDGLLESVLLVAEMRELQANPQRAAKGIVIEARLDKGRGPVATLLVQNGVLRTGDIIVAGASVGRVRAMRDDKGTEIAEAGPSVPVEVTGLAEAPQAGDAFDAVLDERLARELVEQRKQSAKDALFQLTEKVTLDTLFDSLKEGERKDLNLIVKADVQGSVEAVKQSLEKLSNDEVRTRILHCGVGAISESDVMLAAASGAIVIGFNVRPDPVAAQNADRDGVELRMYRIIYDIVEDISSAIKGMLAPKYREVALGRAEVRQVVKISSIGNVAGCYILDGKAQRGAKIRVVRDGIVLTEEDLASLRRFKDDVKEVSAGYECGMTLSKFSDIREGDIFEIYIIEEYRD
ncbi:MAG: translation initiation factor IF-2 [Oscillospiraceae bacterium]|jgi:translation initiation factor IF-2|nr:translation initiation factor IF-2 [Oscillospiraceae bacterium]